MSKKSKRIVGKPRLSAKSPAIYHPSFMVDILDENDEEHKINNRDNSSEFMIGVKYKYLTPAEKQDVHHHRNSIDLREDGACYSEARMDIAKAMRLGVIEVFGWEDQGIITGDDVADHIYLPDVQDMAKDMYNVLMGFKIARPVGKKPEDDEEESSEEEALSSEQSDS